ncbi:MAG: hypothetical protein VW729_13785 [Deltaproteobacteria bacterium]
MSSYLDYQQSIIEEGVLEAAKRIGLNPTIFDSEVMFQHYAGHQWIVFENSVVGTVINAIPPLNLTATIPWEEWFVMDGELRHHILFTEKHENSTMTWEGPMDDQDHPKPVLGKLWHVHNAEPTPYLLP